MNTMPRQLLTSGTAMAAVVGALLLGAEDTGRTPAFWGPSADDVAPAVWDGVPARPTAARRTADERRAALERR